MFSVTIKTEKQDDDKLETASNVAPAEDTQLSLETGEEGNTAFGCDILLPT